MITIEEIINSNRAIKLNEYKLKGGFIVASKKIAKDIKELTSQFDEVDTRYDTSNKTTKIEGDLNLTRLDNITKDEDEIEKLAKDSLKDYYSSNIEKINSNNENNINSLKKSIQTSTENADKLKENINKNYQEVKESASNDALKRGLARSSIVINQLNAFDNAKIEEYNRIDKELTDSVNSINSQIETLNLEKDNALKEFDITYASKLNEKINSLTDELEEKQAEITKYNNEIAQIEADYERNKLDFNNDADQQDFENLIELNEFIAKYGANAINAVKNSEKYEYAYSYFNTLPLEQAKKQIEENETSLRKQLGTAFYNQLYNQFK